MQSPGLARKLIILITILLLNNVVLNCGESELSQLNCGKIRCKFGYYFSLFSGWGSIPDQAGLFKENPAFLCIKQTESIEFSLSPELNLSLNKAYPGYSAELNSEIDELITGVKSDSIILSYPQTEIELEQIGGIRDVSFSIPHGNNFWGISIWKPLSINSEINGNSLLMMLEAESVFRENEETKIVLGNDFWSDISLDLNQTRLGYAHKWGNGIGLGAGIDVLQLSIQASGYSQTEGFIRQYGGDTDITQAFNDPITGEYYRNTLNNQWQTEYDEVISGFNTGIVYEFNSNAIADIGISQPLEQELTGSSEGIIRSLGAVNYDALIGESDGELFNELLLESSRMTYSNQTIYRCNSLIFRYPGIIRLGVSINDNGTHHHLNMATYLGELSFRYKGEVIESGREKSGNQFSDFERVKEVDYSYGIKLKSKLEYSMTQQISQSLALFAGIQYYSLEEILPSDDEAPKLSGFPAGNLGINWQLSRNLGIDMLLIGFPTSILQTRFIYTFEDDK